MEVGKGNYDIAIAISLILLIVAYSIIVFLTILQSDQQSEQ
jgi:tungstate transport system permease protein